MGEKNAGIQLIIAAVAAVALAACASTGTAGKASLTPSGPTMTIDEDMYDAPAMAQKMCEETGYIGAIFISRDAAAKERTCQCGK